MNFIKISLGIVLTGLLFVNCKNTSSEAKSEGNSKVITTEKKISATAKPATTSLKIEGMTCAMGCAKTIEKKLSELDGVQKATVDFENKTATIEFDTNIQSPESLSKVVEATGDGKTYKVTDIKS